MANNRFETKRELTLIPHHYNINLRNPYLLDILIIDNTLEDKNIASANNNKIQ